MNNTKYIGLDLHQATFSTAVLDAEGKLVMEAILEQKQSRFEPCTAHQNYSCFFITCVQMDVINLFRAQQDKWLIVLAPQK